MNISELHQALNAIADEVTDDSKTRLASVTRRVQIARRSKVAGTIVTSVAAVIALVFLPNWGGLPGSNPNQEAGPPTFGSLATVRDGSFLVYKDAGGVRLLKERLGAVGARSVKVSVNPKTGNIGWTQPCQASGAALVQYHLHVNGQVVPSAALESVRYTGAQANSFSNTTCDQPGSPMQVERRLSISPTGNMGAWRTFGIQPGQPALFKLSVTATHDPAGQAALAKARLMLAVFEIPRHPVQAAGVWVDRHIVDPPGAEGGFKFVHTRVITPVPGRTQLSVPVPHNGKQIYVRTFVKGGEGSGIVLSPGAPTRNELGTASSGSWDVEKSISAGPSRVQAAVVTVPAGIERQVVIAVYVRE